MISEIDSLQERVDAIRATGDADLAARAWHALSAVLFQFTRDKLGRGMVPIPQRVTVADVDWLLAELAECHGDAADCHQRDVSTPLGTSQ